MSTKPYILKTGLKRNGERFVAGSVVHLSAEDAARLPLDTLQPATDKEARAVVEKESAGRVDAARAKLDSAKADLDAAKAAKADAVASADRDIELAEMRVKEAERLLSDVEGRQASALDATAGKSTATEPKKGGGK